MTIRNFGAMIPINTLLSRRLATMKSQYYASVILIPFLSATGVAKEVCIDNAQPRINLTSAENAQLDQLAVDHQYLSGCISEYLNDYFETNRAQCKKGQSKSMPDFKTWLQIYEACRAPEARLQISS